MSVDRNFSVDNNTDVAAASSGSSDVAAGGSSGSGSINSGVSSSGVVAGGSGVGRRGVVGAGVWSVPVIASVVAAPAAVASDEVSWVVVFDSDHNPSLTPVVGSDFGEIWLIVTDGNGAALSDDVGASVIFTVTSGNAHFVVNGADSGVSVSGVPVSGGIAAIGGSGAYQLVYDGPGDVTLHAQAVKDGNALPKVQTGVDPNGPDALFSVVPVAPTSLVWNEHASGAAAGFLSGNPDVLRMGDVVSVSVDAKGATGGVANGGSVKFEFVDGVGSSVSFHNAAEDGSYTAAIANGQAQAVFSVADDATFVGDVVLKASGVGAAAGVSVTGGNEPKDGDSLDYGRIGVAAVDVTQISFTGDAYAAAGASEGKPVSSGGKLDPISAVVGPVGATGGVVFSIVDGSADASFVDTGLPSGVTVGSDGKSAFVPIKVVDGSALAVGPDISVAASVSGAGTVNVRAAWSVDPGNMCTGDGSAGSGALDLVWHVVPKVVPSKTGVSWDQDTLDLSNTHFGANDLQVGSVLKDLQVNLVSDSGASVNSGFVHFVLKSGTSFDVTEFLEFIDSNGDLIKNLSDDSGDVGITLPAASSVGVRVRVKKASGSTNLQLGAWWTSEELMSASDPIEVSNGVHGSYGYCVGFGTSFGLTGVAWSAAAKSIADSHKEHDDLLVNSSVKFFFDVSPSAVNAAFVRVAIAEDLVDKIVLDPDGSGVDKPAGIPLDTKTAVTYALGGTEIMGTFRVAEVVSANPGIELLADGSNGSGVFDALGNPLSDIVVTGGNGTGNAGVMDYGTSEQIIYPSADNPVKYSENTIISAGHHQSLNDLVSGDNVTIEFDAGNGVNAGEVLFSRVSGHPIVGVDAFQFDGYDKNVLPGSNGSPVLKIGKNGRVSIDVTFLDPKGWSNPSDVGFACMWRAKDTDSWDNITNGDPLSEGGVDNAVLYGLLSDPVKGIEWDQSTLDSVPDEHECGEVVTPLVVNVTEPDPVNNSVGGYVRFSIVASGTTNTGATFTGNHSNQSANCVVPIFDGKATADQLTAGPSVPGNLTVQASAGSLNEHGVFTEFSPAVVPDNGKNTGDKPGYPLGSVTWDIKNKVTSVKFKGSDLTRSAPSAGDVWGNTDPDATSSAVLAEVLPTEGEGNIIFTLSGPASFTDVQTLKAKFPGFTSKLKKEVIKGSNSAVVSSLPGVSASSVSASSVLGVGNAAAVLPTTVGSNANAVGSDANVGGSSVAADSSGVKSVTWDIGKHRDGNGDVVLPDITFDDTGGHVTLHAKVEGQDVSTSANPDGTSTADDRDGYWNVVVPVTGMAWDPELVSLAKKFKGATSDADRLSVGADSKLTVEASPGTTNTGDGVVFRVGDTFAGAGAASADCVQFRDGAGGWKPAGEDSGVISFVAGKAVVEARVVKDTAGKDLRVTASNSDADSSIEPVGGNAGNGRVLDFGVVKPDVINPTSIAFTGETLDSVAPLTGEDFGSVVAVVEPSGAEGDVVFTVSGDAMFAKTGLANGVTVSSDGKSATVPIVDARASAPKLSAGASAGIVSVHATTNDGAVTTVPGGSGANRDASWDVVLKVDMSAGAWNADTVAVALSKKNSGGILVGDHYDMVIDVSPTGVNNGFVYFVPLTRGDTVPANFKIDGAAKAGDGVVVPVNRNTGKAVSGFTALIANPTGNSVIGAYWGLTEAEAKGSSKKSTTKGDGSNTTFCNWGAVSAVKSVTGFAWSNETKDLANDFIANSNLTVGKTVNFSFTVSPADANKGFITIGTTSAWGNASFELNPDESGVVKPVGIPADTKTAVTYAVSKAGVVKGSFTVLKANVAADSGVALFADGDTGGSKLYDADGKPLSGGATNGNAGAGAMNFGRAVSVVFPNALVFTDQTHTDAVAHNSANDLKVGDYVDVALTAKNGSTNANTGFVTIGLRNVNASTVTAVDANGTTIKKTGDVYNNPYYAVPIVKGAVNLKFKVTGASTSSLRFDAYANGNGVDPGADNKQGRVEATNGNASGGYGVQFGTTALKVFPNNLVFTTDTVNTAKEHAKNNDLRVSDEFTVALSAKDGGTNANAGILTLRLRNGASASTVTAVDANDKPIKPNGNVSGTSDPYYAAPIVKGAASVKFKVTGAATNTLSFDAYVNGDGIDPGSASSTGRVQASNGNDSGYRVSYGTTSNLIALNTVAFNAATRTSADSTLKDNLDFGKTFTVAVEVTGTASGVVNRGSVGFFLGYGGNSDKDYFQFVDSSGKALTTQNYKGDVNKPYVSVPYTSFVTSKGVTTASVSVKVIKTGSGSYEPVVACWGIPSGTDYSKNQIDASNGNGSKDYEMTWGKIPNILDSVKFNAATLTNANSHKSANDLKLNDIFDVVVEVTGSESSLPATRGSVGFFLGYGGNSDRDYFQFVDSSDKAITPQNYKGDVNKPYVSVPYTSFVTSNGVTTASVRVKVVKDNPSYEPVVACWGIPSGTDYSKNQINASNGNVSGNTWQMSWGKIVIPINKVTSFEWSDKARNGADTRKEANDLDPSSTFDVSVDKIVAASGTPTGGFIVFNPQGRNIEFLNDGTVLTANTTGMSNSVGAVGVAITNGTIPNITGRVKSGAKPGDPIGVEVYWSPTLTTTDKTQYVYASNMNTSYSGYMTWGTVANHRVTSFEWDANTRNNADIHKPLNDLGPGYVFNLVVDKLVAASGTPAGGFIVFNPKVNNLDFYNGFPSLGFLLAPNAPKIGAGAVGVPVSGGGRLDGIDRAKVKSGAKPGDPVEVEAFWTPTLTTTDKTQYVYASNMNTSTAGLMSWGVVRNLGSSLFGDVKSLVEKVKGKLAGL